MSEPDAGTAAHGLRDRLVAAVAGSYELEGELGRGGMAAVYAAIDLRLKRRVAIKVLPPELAFDPAIRARFQREAQTAAQLSHPNIVPIHSVDERDGVAYFVMALIDGESLGAVLTRETWIPAERARRILHDVADALAYAHGRGVVHRDIKPDNILIDADSGRPMVTDFGIARATAAGTRLTATGMAVGTPTYMSPEQAVGEREIDGRSDIYSLGAVGYHMLGGRPPFDASNTMALLMKHVTEAPRPLHELRDDVPPEIRSAIERALSKHPEDRWSGAADFRDALIGLAVERQGQHQMAREKPGTPRAKKVRRRKDGDSLEKFAALPVDQRIRKLRMTAFTNLSTIAGLATINLVTSPEFWWFLFPAVFMLGDIGKKVGSLWSDGVDLRRVLRNDAAADEAGAGARGVASRGAKAAALPPGPGDGLAAPEVLAGPLGAWVHRAAGDRAAIEALVAKLSTADRDRIPEVGETAGALLERVVSLAQALHVFHDEADPEALAKLDARVAELREDPAGAGESGRRLALLQRQRATLAEMVARRAALMDQLENAALALENLKLDLVKLRSAGMQAGLGDVQHATREARALSAEIARVLEAVEEVRAV